MDARQLQALSVRIGGVLLEGCALYEDFKDVPRRNVPAELLRSRLHVRTALEQLAARAAKLAAEIAD